MLFQKGTLQSRTKFLCELKTIAEQDSSLNCALQFVKFLATRPHYSLDYSPFELLRPNSSLYLYNPNAKLKTPEYGY